MKKLAWIVPSLLLACVADARADEPAPTAAPATAPAPASTEAAPQKRILSSQPAPLTRLGAAKWEPTLGLVAETQEKDGKEASKDEPASTGVPMIASSSLTAFNLRVFAGIDQRAGAEKVDPVVGAAIRYEVRHVDSLLAPWAEGGFTTTFYDATPKNESDDETGNIWDFWVRGGVDIHPMRERWIGVGPFIGYRQLNARALEQSFILQGLDVGGQIHVRTGETAASRPAFDATAYGFVQGAGIANIENRAFLGTLLSAGGDVRAYAQIEGCMSSPDSCFPRQVRAVAGLGGVF
jgi:hypothetical protein